MSLKKKNHKNYYFINSDRFILYKFNSILLKSGKRSTVNKIVLLFLKEFKINNPLKNNRDFIPFFESFLNRILCRFIIKKRSKGKRKEYIPIPVYDKRVLYKNTLRNLVNVLYKKRGRAFYKVIMSEAVNSFNNNGLVRQHLTDFNKVVVRNRK